MQDICHVQMTDNKLGFLSNTENQIYNFFNFHCSCENEKCSSNDIKLNSPIDLVACVENVSELRLVNKLFQLFTMAKGCKMTAVQVLYILHFIHYNLLLISR